MPWIWMIALPAAAAFGDDWPLRQVCSDIGRVNWIQMRRWLWSQVSATDSGLSLTTKDTRRIGLVSVQALTTYRHGPANEEACWLGVLALQFWGLLMQFPQIYPHEFEVDWRLFASADWTLVLLSEFPIFGLLHQAQQAIQSCEMFAVGTTRLPGGHRLCPLPRCDLQDEAAADAQEIQRAQLFFDMLVNSALAGEAVFMVTLPGVPRCPLGQAAQELAFAVVDAVRYGAGAWPQISRMVMSAKSRMMKWLEGDLSQAPQRRDELGNISTADPLSEVLASRWNVLGLLHTLQVVLRRSVDGHADFPLPWLVAEGPQGLDLLADTRSLRGSFARYLLANLRREFWGGGRGVESLGTKRVVVSAAPSWGSLSSEICRLMSCLSHKFMDLSANEGLMLESLTRELGPIVRRVHDRCIAQPSKYFFCQDSVRSL
ncbi:unnamed protein product [Symbiodinium sp. CCMP2456]|nr:unnamed protein product [Symbiodinium sp. CCMP2456]